MENKNILLQIFVYSIIVLMAVLAGHFLWNSQRKLGGAPPGIAATIATSSTVLVGTSTPRTLTATTTGCAARIITTGSQAIRISFSHNLSSTSLSSTIGHYQSGSSTEHYDSGLFGCDFTTALGIYQSGDVPGSNSSSTVTVTVSY